MIKKVGSRRHFLYLLIQVAFFSFLAWLMVYLNITGWKGALFSSAIFYYLLLVNTRRYLAPDHWKGVRALKKGKWDDAADCFSRSLLYFENRPLLDRFRFLLLMSLSRYSYREMDWINLAFAKGRGGDLQEAYQIYLKAQSEYPENPVIHNSLIVIREDLKKAGKDPDLNGEGTKNG